jgi:hypothetical protein
MRHRRRWGRAAPLLLLAAATACYASSASRQSGRIVRDGFDFDERGPWILVSGPGSLVVAGGSFLVGSVFPLGGGVDPREPEVKWFHAYPGPMRAGEEVAILCHQDRATWVTGIRPAVPGAAWQAARQEKWHFPACIEALPGRYVLEVHYFARETEDDRENSVSRQAESTQPSTALWEAEAGRVYLLLPEIGRPGPASGAPPQRHIPRSRSLGTTWWDLQESEWSVQIEEYARWDSVSGPLAEQRQAWARWEARRR